MTDAAMPPTVSIVLPVHNGQRYLREALDGCLAQTFADWELIVVDDASTDDTPAIITEYAARDPRILTIRNPTNLRLPASLNVGFTLARGRYLTWTSDDNIHRPVALERLVTALDADPSLDLVYARATTIDEDGQPVGQEPIAPPELLALRNCVGACFLYRRAVHDALGGYDETRFLVEDYDFWLRASARFRLALLDDDLYLYRRHGGSLTATRLAAITAAHESCLLDHLPRLPWLTQEQRHDVFDHLLRAALARDDRPAARRIFATAHSTGSVVSRQSGSRAVGQSGSASPRHSALGTWHSALTQHSLRALCLIRPDYLTRPGGDAIHARALVDALRELGVEITLCGDLQPDLAGIDLVHIFNTALVESPLAQAIWARRSGCPAVLSPIYHWHLPRYRQIAWNWRGDPATEAALTALEVAQQCLLLRLVAPIMPSSDAEAAALKADFPDLTAPLRVVHHGIDRRFAGGDGARFCAAYDLPMRGFVLGVGRKEERKNWAAAIVACRALGLPLVLIGHEPEGAADYLARCRALADGADPPIRFLQHLDPANIADAYAAARVHVLPSYFEVAELVSLEAALGGCNIVATLNGGMQSYLGDDAWYCDPDSPDSVKAAIADAWAAPLRPELGPALAERFTWERAARATLATYEEALQMRATGDPDPAFPDADYARYLEDLALAHQHLDEERRRLIDDLAAGLAAERQERERFEDAFRALEAAIQEQTAYTRKLEAALAEQSHARTNSPLRRLLRRS
jgi:glycosyltransferase involved in cell wall biosynthesis